MIELFFVMLWIERKLPIETEKHREKPTTKVVG
jgi:hypothetical protein